MTETIETEVIQIHSKDGRLYLDMPAWPEKTDISVFLVLERQGGIRLRDPEHIEFRLADSRAIYHIDEHDLWRDVFHVSLVYREDPCPPR